MDMSVNQKKWKKGTREVTSSGRRSLLFGEFVVEDPLLGSSGGSPR